MPITKGAIRKLKADKKKALVNLVVRKLAVKATALARKQPTEKNIQDLFKKLDRAVKKGVIHKNRAARLKSRLSRKIIKKKK